MKKVLLLAIGAPALLSAMTNGDDHTFNHVVNPLITTKIIYDAAEWHIRVPAAKSDITQWSYDQRTLLWDYNKEAAIATCTKAGGQTDAVRECYHFYPLAIEALYLDYAIKGNVPLGHNQYHEKECCYYFPGYINIKDTDGKNYRIEGFFESTFNEDGTVLYHRCFNECNHGRYTRYDDYEEQISSALKNFYAQKKLHNQELKKDTYLTEAHKRQVLIYISTELQQNKKREASPVERTYNICETLTNKPNFPIARIEITDLQNPNVCYGIYPVITP